MKRDIQSILFLSCVAIGMMVASFLISAIIVKAEDNRGYSAPVVKAPLHDPEKMKGWGKVTVKQDNLGKFGMSVEEMKLRTKQVNWADLRGYHSPEAMEWAIAFDVYMSSKNSSLDYSARTKWSLERAREFMVAAGYPQQAEKAEEEDHSAAYKQKMKQLAEEMQALSTRIVGEIGRMNLEEDPNVKEVKKKDLEKLEGKYWGLERAYIILAGPKIYRQEMENFIDFEKVEKEKK